MSSQTAPLARFKVLDLTRALAGPAAVRQLADWGADVIKIEMPTDDPNPPDEMSPRLGSYFQNAHRNKRSVTINLRDEKGVEVFYRLVTTADVVVENYRPNVKHRLKVDYETLRAINPRLVYGSISAFGQDGPYADRPGFDQIIQGMGGLMSVTGFPGQGPVRAGTAVSDLTSGLFCAIGILVALLERETTGNGRWVRTSLLESMISIMDFQAVRWLCEGEVPGQVGNDHPTNFPMSAYPTADEPINVAPIEHPMWCKFCDVIGRKDLTEKPAFATEKLRVENKEPLRAEITKALSKQRSAFWIERMNAAGVPCGPIYSMDRMFDDEQVKHLKIVDKLQDPRIPRLQLLRQPVRLDDEPPALRKPVSDRGADSDAVLMAAGFSAAELAELRRLGAI